MLSFLVAFVEYMAADIWKLVIKYMKNIRQEMVTATDVKIALHSDHIILDILNEEDLDLNAFISEGRSVGKRTSLTYEENVKEFILEEEQVMSSSSILYYRQRGWIGTPGLNRDE